MRRVRIFAALLALGLLFTACGGAPGNPVLSLGSTTVSDNVYHYWASTYKGEYLYRYEDVKNTAEYWESELVDGISAAEYFDAVILQSVKYNLVCMKLFDEYGLTITAAQKQSIRDRINDYVTEYADGNKNLLNLALGEYGVNMQMLEQIYIDEAKTTKVYDAVYGKNGRTPLDDEALEKFYKENYVHFQMIFINNMYQYVADENGNPVLDENGYYATEPLDADVKATRDDTVRKVQKRLDAGEAFDALYEEYAEIKDYPGGYYYSSAGTYNDRVYYDLAEAAGALQVGEVTTVQGDYGTCIIQKLDLPDGAWGEKENSDFFDGFRDTVGDALFREFLEGYFDEIVVDADAIAAFSIADVTPNYSF